MKPDPNSGVIPLIAFCDVLQPKGTKEVRTLWRADESLDDAMLRAARRVYGTTGQMYVHSEWRSRHRDDQYWEIEAPVMRLVPYMKIGSIRCRLTNDDGSLSRWLDNIHD